MREKNLEFSLHYFPTKKEKYEEEKTRRTTR